MEFVSAVTEKETRIIFVRHGQSIGNKNVAFLGHTDLDLTDLGYTQAACACRYIQSRYHVDAIYASDLMRAWHTVEPLSKALRLPLIKTKAMREIYAGKWENLLFSEIKERYADDFFLWEHRFGDARCTDGESIAELRTRISAAVEDLAKQNRGKTICIGTHATPIRLLRGVWANLPLARAGEIPWPYNASTTVALYSENGIVVEEEMTASYLGELANGPRLA